MKSKIIAIIIVMLIVVFLALVGCGKKPKEKAPAKVDKNEETVAPAEQQKETKPTKTWTDDDFVEYWAQITYIQGYLVGEKHAKDPVKASKVLADEMNKLEEKFGMTGEQLGERFSAWMTEWTQKAMSEPEKYGKQWEEFNKRVEKRVEELKKGK